MSFNCFRTTTGQLGGGGGNFINFPHPSTGVSVTTESPSGSVNPRSPVNEWVPVPPDMGVSSPTKSTTTYSSSSAQWLRPIAHFRQAGGFTTSAFGACVPTGSRKLAKESPRVDAATPSGIRDTTQSRLPYSLECATERVANQVTPLVLSTVQSGIRVRALGCLVRSQSDSTCLSLKAANGSGISGGAGGSKDDSIGDHADPARRLSSQSDDSASSNLSNSELYCCDQSSGSSELPNLTPVSSKSLTAPGSGGGSSASPQPPPPTVLTPSISTTSTASASNRPVPAKRTYQLVSRDGVQSYELVHTDTPPHSRLESAVSVATTTTATLSDDSSGCSLSRSKGGDCDVLTTQRLFDPIKVTGPSPTGEVGE